MRTPLYLSLLLSILLLAACAILPPQEDTPAVLPTRLVLPTATPVQQMLVPGGDTTAPAQPIPFSAWFPNPDDRTLLGVNPQNQQVTARVLTTFTPQLVAAAQNEVWVTQNVNETVTSLLRLDRQSSQVTDDIPVQYGRATSISAAGNYVWLTMQAPSAAHGDKKGGVVQVDATQRKIIRYIEMDGFPLQVAATPQVAWVLVQDALATHFENINPVSGSFTPVPAAVQNSSDLQLFARFTVHPNGLWAIPQQLHSPYIFHLDLQGKVLKIIKVGEGYDAHPTDIIAGGQSIFVALKNNTIVTLNANNETITSQPVSISAPIDWLISIDQDVWAWSYAAAAAYQINSTGSQMAVSASLGSTPVPTPTVVSYPTPSMMGGSFKPCDGVDFESNLRPGMKAIVNPDPPLPDRVRISASSTGQVVDLVNPSHWMEILEGPACVEGKVWWKVHTQNDVIGWTMEGDGIEHWLLPAPENK